MPVFEDFSAFAEMIMAAHAEWDDDRIDLAIALTDLNAAKAQVSVLDANAVQMNLSIQALQKEIADLKAGQTPAPNPTPTPTPTPVPEPVPSPTPSISWPSGWNDARFAGNTAMGYGSKVTTLVTGKDFVSPTNGDPAVYVGPGGILRKCRIDGGEGLRMYGTGVKRIEDCWIEYGGSNSADHGDGLQDYDPGAAGTTYLLRTVIKQANGKYSNAAAFWADNAKEAIDIRQCILDGTGNPNGGLFIAVVAGDQGVTSIALNDVIIKGGYRLEGNLGPLVKEWVNVRDGNGVPIPRP